MSYLNRFEVKSFVKKKEIFSPVQPKEYVKISIVTASYNQAKYLERTILSVINQNYPKVELIVIDGGSNDGSIDILKKYSDNITFWSSSPDSGQANAINKGLKLATGELLCFQNSDDIFYKNSFHILNNYFQKNKQYDGYFGDLLIIDADDNVLEEIKATEFELKNQIKEGMQIFNQSFYFTKNLLETHGYIDESLKFVIDYENVARWAYNGAKFKKINGLLGAFRIHEDAKTSTIDHIRIKEHNIVIDTYSAKIGKSIFPLFLVKAIIKLKKIIFFLYNKEYSYIIYRLFRNK